MCRRQRKTLEILDGQHYGYEIRRAEKRGHRISPLVRFERSPKSTVRRQFGRLVSLMRQSDDRKLQFAAARELLYRGYVLRRNRRIVVRKLVISTLT